MGRVRTLPVGSQQVEVLFWRHLVCQVSLARKYTGCRETARERKALAVFLLADIELDEELLTRLP